MERLKPHEDRETLAHWRSGEVGRGVSVDRHFQRAEEVMPRMPSVVQGARVCRSECASYEPFEPISCAGDEQERLPRFPNNQSGGDRARRVAPDMGASPAYTALGLTGTA
jgi:hypothetical protein